ncbi:MAG: hypothetical protein ACMUHM_02570 [Thermoplasmatota archaeon]
MVTSERELMVMYALTGWPMASTQLLCEELDMSTSTFATVKRRLIESGIVIPSRVANPSIMEMDVKGIENGFLKPGIGIEEAMKALEGASLNNNCIYYFISDGLNYVYHTHGKKFSSVKNFMGEVNIACTMCESFWPPNRDSLVLEMSQDRVVNLSDYSGLLANHFPQLRGTIDLPRDHMQRSDADLESLNELPRSMKRLLPYLMRVPLMTDSEIAEALGISRQKVGRTRLELERKGSVITGNMINTGSLGFALGAHFTIHFQKSCSSDSLKSFEDKLKDRYLPIFWITSRDMTTFIYYFRDLADFRSFNREILGFSVGEVISSIRSVPFSMTSSTLIRHHYLGETGGKGFSFHNGTSDEPRSIRGGAS